MSIELLFALVEIHSFIRVMRAEVQGIVLKLIILIAFRVGKKPKLNMEWGKPEGYIIQDYHFIMQNNTGGWAHKLNTSPSVYLGDINPDNNSTAWSYPIGIVGDSITSTKYLAVIP